jgi:protein-disulfide isomerase
MRGASGSAELVAAVLAAGLLAAGCTGELAGALAPGGATGATVAGPVAADPSAAAPPKAVFNPFSPDTPAEIPGREVIANPTLAEVLRPGPLPEFSLGRAEAPVVLVKYMSLTCPHCRRFMAETFPSLRREYIDTGKVRLVIREFPIGRTSGNATIALRCAPMDQYLSLYRKFLEQQPAWVSQEVRPDAIFKVAAQVGLKRAEFDACVKDQTLITALAGVKDRGRQLGIIGTPNFFVGNRLVKSAVGLNELRRLLDAALAGGGQARAG